MQGKLQNPLLAWAPSKHLAMGSYDHMFYYFLRLFIYLFIYRQRGRERKRERNINVWLPLTHLMLGPGPQPRHVPWLGIKLASLWFAACAQSTELHQPGHKIGTLKKRLKMSLRLRLTQLKIFNFFLVVSSPYSWSSSLARRAFTFDLSHHSLKKKNWSYC